MDCRASGILLALFESRGPHLTTQQSFAQFAANSGHMVLVDEFEVDLNSVM